MNLIKRNSDFKSICRFVRFYSVGRKTHYDVLNLRKQCTDKEIKEAFIQMSKEYHPDKNKDVRAQDKFVRIVEAYNVLSKPGSRAQYDSMIEVEAFGGSSYVYKTHVPYNLRKNPQYGFYYETKNTQSSKQSSSQKQRGEEPYYGVTGLKKLPNHIIIFLCCSVALVGLIVQLFIVRESFNLHRREALEKSRLLAEELERVRATAKENGNEMQTRLLLEKIVTAANPTVATASLGQSLANEKKDVYESVLTEFGLSEEPNSLSASSKDEMKDYITKLSFQTW